MASTTTLKPPQNTAQLAPKTGRVFAISLKGIPRVDAKTKARLEAAARTPRSKRRDYPQLITEDH